MISAFVCVLNGLGGRGVVEATGRVPGLQNLQCQSVRMVAQFQGDQSDRRIDGRVRNVAKKLVTRAIPNQLPSAGLSAKP